MPPPPPPSQKNVQQQQQQQQQKRGTEGSYVPKELPAVSSLDKSLGEIIQQNSKTAKRKRDSVSSGVGNFSAGPSVPEQSGAGDMLVAKRPKLESARMSDVVREMHHGFAKGLHLRSDPTTPNFEAFGGLNTLALVDNEESYKQVTQNVLERNYRANNNTFAPMAMSFHPLRKKKAKIMKGHTDLSELRGSLLLGGTPRVEDLGEVEREEDIRMEDVGSAVAPTATHTPAPRSPVEPPAFSAPPAPAAPAPGPATTQGGYTNHRKVRKTAEELDEDMRDYFVAGGLIMQ
ncbi:hypothetical protein GGR53DRAFT_72005 [Hypoxylon sp. FL1150]|nr:hypothetical protein GGR53DRAFT_72005 [Hypoxylon sp. FL1150]